MENKRNYECADRWSKTEGKNLQTFPLKIRKFESGVLNQTPGLVIVWQRFPASAELHNIRWRIS